MPKDRAPLSTEAAPPETWGDRVSSDCCYLEGTDHGGVEGSKDGATRPHEQLRIGDRLSGRYRIARVLGEGGMGEVYLAVDEQVVGEIYAIKALKGGFDPHALELLREEVRKTRKLSHPNIVDVHSVNVDGGKLYMLMEYLEGKPLNVLLDEEFGRGIPFSHAWPIIEDVGAALAYAHDHNVIHADLKPANIFVTSSGRTKLLDFGIARVSRGQRMQQAPSSFALTPAYASCELLEGKDAHRRDDIYSFACVIHEMLCAERPFGEFTACEAREAGVRVAPLQVLSKAQNAALAKALSFDRDRRASSVEALLEEMSPLKRPRDRPIALLVGGIIVAGAALSLTYLVAGKPWMSRHSELVQSVSLDARPAASPAAAPVAAFNPPPHSIAVLPFVNISGDKEQEYFSDGLTEELLNSLTRINELQVAARTSSFSFQREHADILTIARKLNVASILEGSVRRSGNTVRVTAQLNSTLTGFHLWSQTYDRDLGDVLKLQTEIADAVTSALKVTLLGGVAARIELGGTHNSAAFDAYLRGLKASNRVHDKKDAEAALAAYAEAIRMDPDYPLARAARSLALTDYADTYATGHALPASYETAQSDARRAIARAPGLADGYLALAAVLESESLDFVHAAEEYQRAVSLAPGNAEVMRRYGHFAVAMGRLDAGLAASRRAVELDPLNPAVHRLLSFALRMAGHYQEAIEAAQGALALDAENPGALTTLGLAYYAKGDYQAARTSCEAGRSHGGAAGSYFGIRVCLAITYDKLGRHSDAEATLKTVQSWYGDRGAFQYAEIYSQWGDRTRALEWLEKAVTLHDSGLAVLKITPLLDPVRNEARLHAIERELKFPP